MMLFGGRDGFDTKALGYEPTNTSMPIGAACDYIKNHFAITQANQESCALVEVVPPARLAYKGDRGVAA